MKLLTTTGLTKLIQLIKSSFISSTDVVETQEVDIDTTVTPGSSNLITSGGVANYHDDTKVDKNNDITGATHTKITYDSKGLVTDGEDLTLTDLGITATASELNYTEGVTSNIQTQLNGKQASLGYTPENVANKKTSITSSSTDTDYPSAKAVYNYVGNGTITLQKNGTTVNTFTTNQSANKTINISVPKTLVFTYETASSWYYDTTYTDFNYACDIYLSGVTSSMSANVTYELQNAISGYYAPICETYDGYVRIYSKTDTAITIPTITVWSE